MSLLGKYIGCVAAGTFSMLPKSDKKPASEAPLPPTLSVVAPPQGFPHQLVWDRRLKRYRCHTCWASSKTKAVIARQACPAPDGCGHAIRIAGPYVLCCLCAAYSCTNVTNLQRLCHGKVRSDISQRRLGNLLSGCDPRTNSLVGIVTVPMLEF